MNAIRDRPLDEEIFSLIEVSRPYYALRSLELRSEEGDQWLYAEAPIESGGLYESCQMNVSEVGRHLAILGSCSGALGNPLKSRHYYLAHEAELRTFSSFTNPDRRSWLGMRAKSRFVNKRLLIAEAEVLDDSGEVMAQLETKYHVMKAKAFDKIYGTVTPPVPRSQLFTNPYAEHLPVRKISEDATRMTFSLGRVQSHWCLGHFEHVKALPVAILCQTFVSATAQSLRILLQDSKAMFLMTRGTIEAKELALSGREVTLQVRVEDENPESLRASVIATTDQGAEVGRMTADYRLA